MGMTTKQYRKKPYNLFKKNKSKNATIKDVKRIANKISLRDNELKYDNHNITTAQNYSWSLYNLSDGIAVGTSDQYRIGDKCTLKYLDIRGSLYGSDNLNVFRIVVYISKSGVNSQHPFETDNSIEAPVSLLAHDYKEKYKILWDRTFSTNILGQPPPVFNKRIQLKNLVTSYQVSTTTAIRNAVYVAVVSDSAAVGHPQPYFHCRLHYTG